MMPTGVKITGLYTTSILAKTEAIMAGFDEAILLNHDGSVSEGSGGKPLHGSRWRDSHSVRDGKRFC